MVDSNFPRPRPADIASPVTRSPRRLAILYLEDGRVDVALVKATLDAAGLESLITRVRTEAEFQQALSRASYDLILSDFSLAGYDGMAGLQLAQKECPATPFLFVSGTPEEQDAHGALVQGVPDDVLKSSLSQLVPAIVHTFADAQMRRKKQERALLTLADVSITLGNASERDEMLRLIVDQVAALLNAQRVAIELMDPITGTSVIPCANGKWKDAVHSNAAVQESVPNQTSPLSSSVAPVSATRVPLVVQGQSIGALLVETTAPLGEDNLRILHAIANIAANAIHRADLDARTESQLEQIRALYNIDQAICSSHDLDWTLGVIIDQVTSRLGVDAADILILDARGENLEFRKGKGFRTSAFEKTRLPSSTLHAGQAAPKGETAEIADWQREMTNASPSPFVQALRDEAFVGYYCSPLVVKDHVKGMLEVFHRSPLNPCTEWLDLFRGLAAQAALAVENASLSERHAKAISDLSLAYDATIEGWSRALDLRDRETEGHSIRVTELTLRLAKALNVPDAELVHYRRGALLHDIGKMGVPDQILLKQEPLTEEEWKIMRRHPTYALGLLSPIQHLRPALDIPYCHHENWDGTGYPLGLKREEIPLAARIFAVVDVWDAVCSDRPYRPAWPRERAARHLRAEAGRQFDPSIVKVFLKMMGEDQ